MKKILVIVSGLYRDASHSLWYKNIPGADVVYTTWTSTQKQIGESHSDEPYHIDKVYNLDDYIDMSNVHHLDDRWATLQHLAYALAYRDFAHTNNYDVYIRARWDLTLKIIPIFSDIQKIAKLVCERQTAWGFGLIQEDKFLRQSTDIMNTSFGRISRLVKGMGWCPDWLIMHTADMFDAEKTIQKFHHFQLKGAEWGWGHLIDDNPFVTHFITEHDEMIANIAKCVKKIDLNAENKEEWIMSNQQKATWGSHVPINRAIMHTFDIKGVMEFGMGWNSTPIFHENCDKVVSIENDLEWIKECNIEQTDKKIVVHHDVTPAKRADRIWNKPEQYSSKARQFYREIRTEHSDCNMLFVDQYSSLRNLCLDEIHDTFDVVVFHDVEYRHRQHGLWLHYSNEKRQDAYTGFIPVDGYTLFVDKTYRVWTGILVRNELEDKFQDMIEAHWNYVGKHVPMTINLQKYENPNDFFEEAVQSVK